MFVIFIYVNTKGVNFKKTKTE